jgi:hypothetical protein
MEENNLKREETISIKNLGYIVFDDRDEVTAERKASSTFKRACKALGVDPQYYKSSKSYEIPKSSINMWKLFMQNIDAIEGNPSKNGFVQFIENLIITKDEMDKMFENLENHVVDEESFQKSMNIIYEMYFTSAPYGKSITMELTNDIMKIIYDDLNYIRENAPDDRMVFYTDQYYKMLKTKAEYTG